MDLILANLATIAALAATGIVAGLLAGFLGVGGGIVIVPVLYFLFQSFGVSAQSAVIIATATSLATIVPTSLSSIKSHQTLGNVDFSLLKSWSVFILFGVLCGSLLVTEFGGLWLSALFGMVAMFVAFNLLFRTKTATITYSLPSKFKQGVIASFIGFFSSMVGIGGGTFSLPVLSAYNFSTPKAVGTAAGIGLIISFPAAITMMVFGETPNDAPIGTYGLVNLLGFVCIVPLTVLSAPFGAKLTSIINAQIVKRIFAGVLLLTGIRMLLPLFF